MWVQVRCLSSSGCDLVASRNPNESNYDEDKHQAPTLPHFRPLSLQDGDTRIPEFGREKPSGRGRIIPLFSYQTSSGRVTHIPPFGRQHSLGISVVDTRVPKVRNWLSTLPVES